MITPRISLKIIVAPATGHILDAPPVLMASDHSVDYICGRCSTILLHAEENQVRGVLIRCANCGHTIQRTRRLPQWAASSCSAIERPPAVSNFAQTVAVNGRNPQLLD